MIDDDRIRVNILYCIGWQYKSTYLQVKKIIEAQVPDAIITGGDYPASDDKKL